MTSPAGNDSGAQLRKDYAQTTYQTRSTRPLPNIDATHLTRRSWTTGVAALLAMGAVPAAAAARGFSHTWRAIADGWRAEMVADGMVGGALLFARRGETLAEEYFGSASLEDSRAVQARTLFHWGSISQLFTSVVAMQLRDEGRLSLDDSVARHLPEFAAVHCPFGPVEQVTLRHLLSHSAGLRLRSFDPPKDPKPQDQIAAMMSQVEIEFAPGSRSSYSDIGMSVLGQVLQRLVREDFRVLAGKNILRPIGMRDSSFGETPPFLSAHRSGIYKRRADGTLRTDDQEVTAKAASALFAGGSLSGSIRDLKRFTDAMLGVRASASDFEILKPVSWSEMFEPGSEISREPNRLARIGLGFSVIDHTLPSGRTTRLIGHASDDDGCRGVLQINPETGAAFVAIANTTREGGRPWTTDLSNRLCAELLPRLRPVS